MRVTVGVASWRGRRDENQDCALVAGFLSVGDVQLETTFYPREDRSVVVAVLDGMGGHAGGGVASRVAAAVLANAPAPRSVADVAALIAGADAAVSDVARAMPDLGGMGTTVAGFVIGPGAYHVFHVGDSSAYRFAEGMLGTLTVPHRVPDPTRPGAQVLARSIGRGSAWADVESYPITGPVRLLTCSDGVGEVLDNGEIKAALSEGGPVRAAGDLVDRAFRKGSTDNLTAIVIDVAVRT